MDDDELTPEQIFAAESPDTMVPRALMEGREPENIVVELVRQGWTLSTARALVANAAYELHRFQDSDDSRAKLIQESRGQFFLGLAIALFGGGLSVATICAALAGGLPFFVVSFGLLFGGLALAGRGWARWRFYRNSARLAELDAAKWDRQIEDDVAAGRLDWLAEEARQDLKSGRTTDL